MSLNQIAGIKPATSTLAGIFLGWVGLTALFLATAGIASAQAPNGASAYQYRVPIAISAEASSPNLQVSPSGVTFADLVVGQSAASAVILENSGTAPLTLNSIGFSGDSAFTIDSSSCAPQLGSGQNCAIGVTFAPPARGQHSGVVSVSTSAGPASILLAGRGLQGVVQASASSLTFDPVIVGSNSSRSLQISNTGDAVASGLSYEAAHPFSVGGGCSVVAPGGTCELLLQFQPTGSGAFNGSLVLSSPIGNLSVMLSGSALAAEAIPSILSGNPVNFGSVEQNGSAVDRQVLIRNTGNVPMTLTGVSDLPSSVTLANNTCANVQPAQTCELTLRMTSATVGSVSATSSVQGGTTPASLTLSGSVTAPPVVQGAGFMVSHLYDEGDEFGTTSTWLSDPVYAYAVFKNTSGATLTINGVKSCGVYNTQLYTVTSASGPSTLGGAYTVFPFSPLTSKTISGTRNYSLANCASGAWNTSIGNISVPNGAYFLMEDASASTEAVFMARTTSGQVISVRKPASTSFTSTRYAHKTPYFNGMTDLEFVPGQLQVN